jgi:GntR family transcriptional regulator
VAERTTRTPRRLWPGTHRIDIRSPVPKYSQLRTILLDVIAEAAVDDPAPSERELMARFGVARMTARKAVDHLVAEGRLYRVQGKGTYVARPKIEMPLRLSSFTEDMRARGLHPGSRELDRRVVPAGRTLAASLQVGIDAEIVVLERLRLADGVPMAIERCHVPASVAPGLVSADLTNRSLYAYLEQEHGIVLDAGEQLIEATVIDPADARVLAIPPTSAVLLLTRRSSARGVPVEYVVSTYRADRYQLRAALDAPIPNRSPGGRP